MGRGWQRSSCGHTAPGGRRRRPGRGPRRLAVEAGAARVRRDGAALFARHCATCHGTHMRNPQWAINLRDFPRNAHARFVDSVTNGKRNMPPWDDVLDPDDIEALWAYVIGGESGD